jgi:RNA polymerase sigma-70 factor (ECF subfamily)
MSETPSAAPAQSEGSTSRTLLNGLRSNDAAAWNRLVMLYAPLVYHWCRQGGIPPAEMDDLLQEVFQSVATNIGRFRKDRSSDTFRGWLRTITRSKMANYCRRPTAARAVGGTSAYVLLNNFPASGESSSLDDRPSDDQAERELLERALGLIREEFEERTWQAFWQTSVQNRPASEVATDLAMSSGAVRVAKCRVLRRLRQELGDAWQV